MVPETQPETQPGTQPESSPQQLLQQWIGDLPYQLLLLEKVLLGRSTPFDYSPESLETLEARLLEHHDSVQEPEKRAEFVESAMAYLGEVLLGIAGGGWGWNTRPVDDRPGQPVVWPDPDLELSPIAPRLLIAHALRVRTGTAFAHEVERLREAVSALQDEVPGWKPVKQHTPRVDPTVPMPEDPVLTAWLAERRKSLSAWAKDAFNGAWRWHFHPDTLDWLETVVRQRFATVEEFDAAQEDPFVQGACWYLGEVIRRVKGAVWQYIPFDPDAEPGAPGSRESPWTEVPFVDQPDKRVGGAAIPLGCLRELFLTEESLRDVLIWFRASSYAQVGALLARMGMVSQEKVDSVLDEYADFAHNELPPHEVASALKEFGVAVSAHGDDVDDLEESYAGILAEAEALTDGAVTITDVQLRTDEKLGEVLEFKRNGVVVIQQTEHESDDYLDHMAIMEFIGHVDPDPDDDPRRFHLVQFVRRRESNYDSYFLFATPDQATALEKQLGLEMR
ncbi:hypothetical protein [Streptomyces sp. NPDC059649]|uniref:hypothetical protein n=1 Tax=Streptomyces sp. NPDC059649 TaxID=3346895 RepID=UPI0036A4DC8D